MQREIQRIARIEKKAFLSDQCKEIEENNRMGKKDQISLQENQRLKKKRKKIRDTKGTFHAKMGTI